MNEIDTLSDTVADALSHPHVDLSFTLPTELGFDANDPLTIRSIDDLADSHNTAAAAPAITSDQWFAQSADGLCVPASVAMVVAAFTGQSAESVGERTQAEALRLHLLKQTGDTFSGMSPDAAVTLLDDFGVPAHVEQGTIADLERHLDEGHAVIVSVDSHELPAWHEADVREKPDHALFVREIDRETGLVFLEDPGHPEGRDEVLTIAELEDAWNDSGHTMVVTDAARHAADASTATAVTETRGADAPTGLPTRFDIHLPSSIGADVHLPTGNVPQGFVILPIVVAKLLAL